MFSEESEYWRLIILLHINRKYLEIVLKLPNKK